MCVCVCVCVPVSESHLQSRAVSLQSAECDTDLFRLCFLSLQSRSQLFIFGLQPLDAPEMMRESKNKLKKKEEEEDYAQL